jgi:uncharacterized lipoprotein YddW (UPF0748 family)
MTAADCRTIEKVVYKIKIYLSTKILKMHRSRVTCSAGTTSGFRSEIVFRTVLLLLALGSFVPRHDAEARQPKYEMRGAWVTTVYNLDWPLSRFAPPGAQQADMTTLFDALAESGINAVFFQVRSEADAMYASPFEPWSRFLTGTQGRAPSPFYDPLAEAVRLAHERGMELHAWLNPFRAVSALGKDGLAGSHLVHERPEWLLDVTYKGTDNDLKGTVVTIINPGIPEARTWITGVIADIVSRYEVDGIHFDDYFYPYPSYSIGLEDEQSFNTYQSGQASIEVWRRDNINRFMAEVHTTIQAVDPGVRFGVSPFGIWKNGVPQGIVGLDAYNVLYADPVTWMTEETVDYLAPQLYWAFGNYQDFGLLADWWVEQAQGTHIYPGIAVYRADPSTATGTLYLPDEIPAQISFGRTSPGIEGNLFFRARNLGPANNQGLTARLQSDFYQHKAITPYMTYGDTWPPDPPANLTVAETSEGRFLRWDPALPSGFAYANRFAVYRTQDDGSTPDPRAITNEVANLLHISWEPEWTDTQALVAGATYHYVVTGLSPNSIESNETNVVSVTLQGTGVDPEMVDPALVEWSVYPNPAASQARIRLQLRHPAQVDIRIIDMLGREVAQPLGVMSVRSAGELDIAWDLRTSAGQRVAPGVYQVSVRAGGQRSSKPLVVVR